MHKATRWRLVVGGAIASITMLGSVFVVPNPAQAYGDDEVSYGYAKVSTGGGCPTIGNLRVEDQGDVCVLPDEVDGTWFKDDLGGGALKLVLRDRGSGEMLGKVEWHPYGEHLWVYDTKNDGDTFYFQLWVESPNQYADNYVRTFRAPGTSARIDIGHWNLDFPENLRVVLRIFDDRQRTDDIIGGRFGYGYT